MAEGGFDCDVTRIEERFPSIFDENGADMDTFIGAIIFSGFRKAKYELKELISSTLKKDGNFVMEDLQKICDSLHTSNKINKGQPHKTKGQNIKKIEEKETIHSYDEAEIIAFAEWLTKIFANEPLIKEFLPITKDNLFECVENGIVLCMMVNAAFPNTIDRRLLKGTNSLFEKYEKCNMAIKSAEAIGCSIVNIGAQDILDGNQIIILGLVWQLIKKMLLSKINLIDHPNLFLLIKDTDMTLEDLARMSPEQLLVLWVNYQLSSSSCDQRINSFPEDIKDGVIYAHLINQIAPRDPDNEFVKLHGPVNMPVINSSDKIETAKNVLNEARKIDADVFVRPADIVRGNPKLNYAFLAYLFNNFPNLEQHDAPVIEETREERAIRNWMNSYNLHINYLYFDLRSGLGFLTICDTLIPGCVKWSRVNNPFDPHKEKFQKIENCNYVIILAKSPFNLSTVNISGPDICNGTHMLTLALAWQFMNYDLLGILSKLLNENRRPSDSEVLSLVNDKLTKKVSSFRSKEFSNSEPLFDLLRAVKGDLSGLELFMEENSYEAKMKNAVLILSLIRKCGGKSFFLPEDIVECKSKQIMLICASILSL